MRRPPGALLLAPDALKGCLAAPAVAEALALGFAEAWPATRLVRRPLADGGEGTLLALQAACGGAMHPLQVTGPHGAPVEAAWWSSPDGALAVVELARAAGLSLTERRDVARATTAGVGTLIAAALASGAARVLVGAGGSATCDGGAGALAALGFRLLDGAGRPLPPGGGALSDLVCIEPPASPPALERVEILVDVRNPLLGPQGAAAVYGPQKGADPETVAWLEAGLDRLAAVCRATFGRDPGPVAGAGAAGGFAGGLWAALGVRLRSGFDAIAELVDLDGALSDVDLVVGAEGRVDAQTPFGKTAAGLAGRCARAGRPLWVFAGEVTPEAEGWAAAAGLALVPIAPGPLDLSESRRRAPELLRRAAARAARLVDLRPGG